MACQYCVQLLWRVLSFRLLEHIIGIRNSANIIQPSLYFAVAWNIAVCKATVSPSNCFVKTVLSYTLLFCSSNWVNSPFSVNSVCNKDANSFSVLSITSVSSTEPCVLMTDFATVSFALEASYLFLLCSLKRFVHQLVTRFGHVLSGSRCRCCGKPSAQCVCQKQHAAFSRHV